MIEIMKEKYKTEFKTHKLNSGKSTNKKSIYKKTKLAQLWINLINKVLRKMEGF